MTATVSEPAAAGAGDLRWAVICPAARIEPERGVAALLGEVQVAVFRTFDGELRAVGNIDPVSGAAVLSRGIVGDRGGVPTIASPVYKEVFDLTTGRCLDRPDVALPVYAVRELAGMVEIGLHPEDG